MFETSYSWNAGIKDNKYTFVKEAYAGGSMTNFIMEIAGLVTLVQDCSISIANAHEILQSYTKPSNLTGGGGGGGGGVAPKRHFLSPDSLAKGVFLANIP